MPNDREDKIARYCIECGKAIPEKGRFCPFCGGLNDIEKLSSEPVEEIETPAPEHESPEINTGYVIYEPGDEFRGYRITRLLNKDTEGLKYVAEKDGKKYLIKMLFEVGFASVQNLYKQQMRLSRIAKIKSVNLASVVEVNLSDDPCYMVTEYVEGQSLAELREQIPENGREAFISSYIPDLIDAAIQIREHGLTINKLALTGIMIDQSGRLVVLSSAIKFEEVDEREDVFYIGGVIAQFLAPAGLHKLVYSFEQLALHKYVYINGVTTSLNKLLAECLHRNILQRVTDLKSLKRAFESLPDIAHDTVWFAKEKTKISTPEKAAEAPKPKGSQDWTFWLILASIFILAGVFIAKYLVDRSDPNLRVEQYQPQEAPVDTVNVDPNRFRYRSDDNATLEGVNPRNLLRRELPQVQEGPRTTSTPSTQAPPRRAPMPATFVFVEPGTFGFGRMQGNHNVSLSGFYISKYELTQGEWNRFMRPAQVSTPGDRMPVENISWRQVVTYCNGRSDAENLTRAYRITGSGANEVITCDFSANGYRMPTEAEWEYAAKAGLLTEYSGSDEPGEVAWYRQNSAGRIHEVGSKTANAKGLYDMTGNVSEWVWDWFNEDYPRSPDNINPRGPSSGTYRSIRGGNILNGEGPKLIVVGRERGNPNQSFPYVGVRLVRSM